jgi:hypothetical protein
MDIKNAKNRAKTQKIRLKQVSGTYLQIKIKFRAKLKKTGPNCKGFLRWKDRVANLEKLRVS